MSAPRVGDIVRFKCTHPHARQSAIWRHREDSGQAYLVVHVDSQFGKVEVYEPSWGPFDGTLGTFIADVEDFTVISAANHPAEAVAATEAREVTQ
jgi:hypothetical protein